MGRLHTPALALASCQKVQNVEDWPDGGPVCIEGKRQMGKAEGGKDRGQIE